MSILDFKGKNAGPGPLVIYQLVTGPVFYTECAREEDDSYVFDSEKTLLVSTTQVKGNGQAMVQMQKLSDVGFFKSLLTRVPKTAIAFMQDCGNSEVQAKCQEALSGLILPKGSLPAAN